MARTALNYNENGGDKTVIGGEIDVTGELKLKGNKIVQAANQANSTASDIEGLVTDFNALLAKLKTAGLMVADS